MKKLPKFISFLLITFIFLFFSCRKNDMYESTLDVSYQKNEIVDG